MASKDLLYSFGSTGECWVSKSMKSNPESANIAMLSSKMDPAVPTTVLPAFNRSLIGFMIISFNSKYLSIPKINLI